MLLCPADVAAELGVSRSLVAQWIRAGRLRVRRDRRGWAWIERREMERVREERRGRKRKRLRPQFEEVIPPARGWPSGDGIGHGRPLRPGSPAGPGQAR
jgi:hypothetical protein